MMSNRSEWALNAFVALLLVFLVLPILVVIPSAFGTDTSLNFPPHGFTLRWFGKIVSRPELIEAFMHSVEIAAVATTVSLVAGTMASLVVARNAIPGSAALQILYTSPLTFPAIVLAAAIAIVLAPLGLLRSFWGLVLAHIVVTLPYIIRTVGAAIGELDASCEEAALTLGATPWRRFWTVTLPQLKPGLIAGGTFAFIISFDEFTLSLFLVGNGMMTLPIEMYNYAEFSLDPTLPAISTLMLVMTVVAVLLIERFVGLARHFS